MVVETKPVEQIKKERKGSARSFGNRHVFQTAVMSWFFDVLCVYIYIYYASGILVIVYRGDSLMFFGLIYTFLGRLDL